eukprot:1702882-Amphidinium_carterae.2
MLNIRAQAALRRSAGGLHYVHASSANPVTTWYSTNTPTEGEPGQSSRPQNTAPGTSRLRQRTASRERSRQDLK